MTAPVPIKNHLTFPLQNRASTRDTTFFWADECWFLGGRMLVCGRRADAGGACTKHKADLRPSARGIVIPFAVMVHRVFAFPQVIA
jgi:hypothetical protein